MADDVPLEDVRSCPTQFQGRVPGVDVRVHVVGAEIFATRIDGDADDYRYASRQGLPRPRLSATDLPDDVAKRCRLLAARLDLPVAGVDLRVTPEEEWFCFEVNPSPAFLYYETGHRSAHRDRRRRTAGRRRDVCAGGLMTSTRPVGGSWRSTSTDC